MPATTGAKGGAGKKGAPAKDTKKQAALEEITDNRPREMSYKLDIVEGEPGIEVTEEIAHAFGKAHLNIQIFNVDRETQEEKLVETL